MAENNQNVARLLIIAIAVVIIVAAGSFFVFHMPSDESSSTPTASSATGETPAAAPSGDQTTAPAAPTVATGTPKPVKNLPPQPDGLPEMAIGSPTAPVTIVEWASLTCPHCREFMVDRLPELKKKYIDTGLVRLIFRDYPLDGYALRAAMIAHCAGPDRYFAYIDAYFEQQLSWIQDDPMEGLKRVARFSGMSSDDIDKCLADKELSQKIVAGMQTAQKDLGVNSTPTFLFDGSTFSGALPVEQYEEMFDAALKKAGVDVK